MEENNPPRLLGGLLTVLGLLLAVGGVRLLMMGDSFYFLTVGIGVAVSGVLIALGKHYGVLLYLVMLFVMLVWSAIEENMEFAGVLPRILVPILIGAYLISERVQSRLK